MAGEDMNDMTMSSVVSASLVQRIEAEHAAVGRRCNPRSLTPSRAGSV
jgi:hypothetical protein